MKRSFSQKKELGQFFSTNSSLLRGLRIAPGSVVVDPFCGRCDLFRHFLTHPDACTFEVHDIDPKAPREVLAPLNLRVQPRDSLLNCVDYGGKFVLTNPPYLASNKTKNKHAREVYAKFQHNDLFKCFLASLLCAAPPRGGFVVVPIAFFSSYRKKDIELRKQFLHTFRVECLNIFEKRMFADTTYSVCSFLFLQRETPGTPDVEHVPVLLSRVGGCSERELDLGRAENCTFGNEVFRVGVCAKRPLRLHRLLDTEKEECGHLGSVLTLLALDEKSGKRINMSVGEPYFGKHSARTRASLAVSCDGEALADGDKHALAAAFNAYLGRMRRKYCGLFLTQYRDGSRKRIAYGMAYKILQHCWDNLHAQGVPTASGISV